MTGENFIHRYQESIISNTQWTVICNITDLTHEFTLHRHWDDRFTFDTLAQ